MIEIAAEVGLEHTRLHRTLTLFAGDKWSIRFNSDEFNIHETVEFTIPRLLPDETIKAIHKQVEANKTFHHGNAKNRYLLNRMVFCHHCGAALSGQTRKCGKQYYRHKKPTKTMPCSCPAKGIDAAILEDMVLHQLFETFGNPKAVERAIKAAIPNPSAVVELRKHQERIEASLDQTKASVQRLVTSLAKGTISDEDAKPERSKLAEQEAKQQDQLQKVKAQLEHLPSEATIRMVSDEVVAQLQQLLFPAKRFQQKLPNADLINMRLNLELDYLSSPDALDAMPWEDKKTLMQMVFGGKTPKGKRMGVYIEWIHGEDGAAPQWRYSIRGQITEQGWFPPSSQKPRNSRKTESDKSVNKIASALSLPSTPWRGG
jgi:hypothetical protein